MQYTTAVGYIVLLKNVAAVQYGVDLVQCSNRNSCSMGGGRRGSILSPETKFQTGHSISPRANVKKERTFTSIPPIRLVAETPFFFFNIVTNIEIDTERCRCVTKADVGNEPSTSTAT